MYQDFFGLRCPPFEDRADTRFFFATPAHEEILAALEFEAHYGKNTVLVTGDAGTGKTLLLRTLILRLHACDHVVLFPWPASGQPGILRETCKGFGVTLPSRYSDVRALARLRRQLTNTAQMNHRSILVVDQVENFHGEEMTQIATLTDLRHGDDRLLTVMLSGQSRVKSLLEKPEFDRFRQQLFSEHAVNPLTRAQTMEYIEYRLRIAGAGDARLFDEDAVTLLYHASKGIPRLINRIGDAAMLAAFGADAKRITASVVGEVTQTILREKSTSLRDVGLTSPRQLSGGLEIPMGSPTAGQACSHREETSTACAASDPVASVAPLRSATEPNQPCADPMREDVSFTADPPGPDALAKKVTRALDRLDRIERNLGGTRGARSVSTGPRSGYPSDQDSTGELERDSEELVYRLNQVSERAVAMVDSTQAKVDQMIARAEARLADMEARIDHASETAGHAGDRAERVERACDDADRIKSQLLSFTEDLADKADRVQSQTASLAAVLEAGKTVQRDMESVMVRAVAAKTDMDATTEAGRTELRSAVKTSEGMLHDITAKVLAGFHQKFHEQFKEEEQRQLDAMAATREQLKTSLEQAESTFRKKLQEHMDTQNALRDRTITDAKASLQLILKEVDQKQQAMTDRVWENYQTQLTQRFHKEEKNLREQVESAISQLQTTLTDVESTSTRARKTADNLCGQLDQRTAQLGVLENEFKSRMVADLERQVSTWLDEHKKRFDEYAGDAQRELNTIRNHVASLTSRARSAFDEITKTHRAELSEVVAKSRNEVEEIVSTCRRVQIESSETAVRTCDDLQQRMEQLDTRRTTLEPVVEKLQESVRIAASETNGLDKTIEQVTASVDQLARCADLAEGKLLAATDRAQQSLSETETCCGRVETVQRSVAHTLMDIGQAAERLHTMREETKQCEQLQEGLRELHHGGADLQTRLAKTLDGARQIQDSMQNVLGIADEKISRLDSHNASASHVLGELTQANINGRTTTEQIDKSVDEGRKTIEDFQPRIDALIREVWSLTEKTQINAEVLAKRHAEVEEAIANMKLSKGSIGEVSRMMNERIEVAKKLIEDLASRSLQSGKLVDRLHSITQVLTSAKELGTEVKRAVDDARDVQNDIEGAADRAVEQSKRLENANAVAHGVIETQEQLKHEVEIVSLQLENQLTAAKRAVDSRENLMNEFISQAQALAKQLQTMSTTTSCLEEKLTNLTTKPEEIVESARTQAAQLERVCGAVRKVFSGLSRASLDAQSCCKDIDQKKAGASQRLTQLIAQTEQAATTLHEWVEEAVHAQGRLERTLQKVPPISKTHPARQIHERPRLHESASRVANPSTVGELRTVAPSMASNAGMAELQPERLEKEVAMPASRATEISKLIEESKRAAAQASATNSR